MLFAQMRVKGKRIRRSLKALVLSVAELRLGDLEGEERQIAEHATAYVGGKMTFGDALAICRQRLTASRGCLRTVLLARHHQH